MTRKATTMKHAVTLLTALLLAPPAALDGADMPTPAGRPNIVLFLIDDLGWRDLGCQGSTFYQTPNIDRLATRGRALHRCLRGLRRLFADARGDPDRQVSGAVAA